MIIFSNYDTIWTNWKVWSNQIYRNYWIVDKISKSLSRNHRIWKKYQQSCTNKPKVWRITCGGKTRRSPLQSLLQWYWQYGSFPLSSAASITANADQIYYINIHCNGKMYELFIYLFVAFINHRNEVFICYWEVFRILFTWEIFS